MRPSRLFLSWALLASTAVALSNPERWQFEARDGLMERQDPATTDAAPTELPSATDITGTPIPTDVQFTTSEAPTTPVSDPAAIPTSDPAAAPTSSPVESASQLPTSEPIQTSSSSSVGLLFTQTQATTRPVITVTSSPTADNSDSNVAFFDSKYHQLIIALASISAALLIALIVTAIIAFRARADNDLLHDQLARQEEGISLQQRGKAGSLGTAGGYGRLSLNDPDDMGRSRRSLSESQLRPMDKRRLSGAPMGSGTPPGNRRITFSGSDTTHSQSDHSTTKGDPPFSDSQHAMNRTGSSDSAIRRLPTAPGTSGSSHEGYTDPFAGGATR